MDTPRGLQTFQPTPDAKYEQGKAFAGTDNALLKSYKNATPQEREGLNLEIRRNIYDQKGKDLAADLKDKQQSNGDEAGSNGTTTGDLTTKQIEDIAKEPKKPIYCHSCAIECSRIRYHYAKPMPAATKLTSLDLCPACFADGRYADATKAVDFIKLDDPTHSNIPDKDAPWSDAELLLLLEALEKFDENWNQIADYVGTRTRDECVIKFLQLEIEDKYLEPEVSGAGYSGLDTGRVPFSQGDNPVLSVLGFLAGLSEPAVAAAAAGRSVDEMTKIWRKRIENGVGGESTDKGKEKESMKAEGDSMEIDTASPQPSVGNQVAVAEAEKQRDPMKDIANATFATAAARAAALASNEEREMTRLVSAAVNTTLQKFELKLQQFSEMEAMLQAERRELDRGRQQLFLDRLAFRKRVAETQEALKNATLRGGEEGAKMAQDVPMGGGERLGFQREAPKANVEQLSAGAPGYQSYEI